MSQPYLTHELAQQRKKTYRAEDIQQELNKLKSYFEIDQRNPLSENSNGLIPYISDTSNGIKLKDDNISTASKIDSERKHILAQNSRLKEKLKREKSFRKELNKSLQKQANLLQNLMNDMSFTPSLCNIQEQNKKKQKKHRTFKQIRGIHCPNQRDTCDLNQKRSTKNIKQHNLTAHIFREQPKMEGQSTRNTSKHSKTSINVKTHRSRPSSPPKQSLKKDLSIEHKHWVRHEPQLENNEVISDSELLAFLNNKLQQLMRQSQKQENRANKLKIRNEIGRIVSQINKLKMQQGSVEQTRIDDGVNQKFSVFSKKAASQYGYEKSQDSYTSGRMMITRNLMSQFEE